MDDRRFDDLVRGVGCLSRRRWVLRLLAAGLFGALPALRRPEATSAKCVRLGKKCDKQKDKCCGGAKCKHRCKCRRGRKPCNGACIASTSCCPGVERACAGGCIPVGNCCVNADCNGGVCSGGVCQRAPFQGICTAQTNYCQGSTSFECGSAPGTCACVVHGDGLSYCAQFGLSCVDCTSDAQCEAILATPGAVCVQGPSGGCDCSPSGTACMTPCLSPA